MEIRAVASGAKHSNQINRESSQQSNGRQFSEEKHVMAEALRGLCCIPESYHLEITVAMGVEKTFWTSILLNS
jgi:hypothetical protein